MAEQTRQVRLALESTAVAAMVLLAALIFSAAGAVFTELLVQRMGALAAIISVFALVYLAVAVLGIQAARQGASIG